MITPPDGTATHLMLQVAGRTAVPVVSLCPDASVLGAGLPWLVRVVPGTINQASCLMDALLKSTPASATWSAIVPTGRAGREAGQDLQRAAASHAGLALTTIEHPAHKDHRSALAQQLASENPEVVLLWLDPEPSGQWAALLRSSGFRGVLAGTTFLQSPCFLQSAGPAAEGVWSTTYADSSASHPPFAPFRAAFLQLTGGPPDALAAYAHDAVYVLRALARQTGTAPLDRPRSFGRLPPLVGLSGPLGFNSVGERTNTLTAVCWRDDHWQSQTPQAGRSKGPQ